MNFFNIPGTIRASFAFFIIPKKLMLWLKLKAQLMLSKKKLKYEHSILIISDYFLGNVCDSTKAQDIETLCCEYGQHQRFYQKNNGEKIRC
jgi:hypothetical protein